MTRAARAIALLAALAVPTATRVALAQTPAPPASHDAADGALDQGAAALQQARYAEAVTALERANALAPRPVVLYDLGLAYRGVGRIADAIDAFERYLAAPEPGAEPARLQTLRTLVGQMHQQVGTVAVRVDPPDARVEVDGRLRAARDREVLLDAGEHTIEASADGRRTERRVVRLAPLEHRDLALALAPAPSNAGVVRVRAEPRPAVAPAGRGPMLAGPIVLLGVGAAAFGFAALAWFVGRENAEAPLRAACPSRVECDPVYATDLADAQRWAAAAVVGDVVGGVALAGGVAWLIVAATAGPERAAAVRPVARRGYTGFTVAF